MKSTKVFVTRAAVGMIRNDMRLSFKDICKYVKDPATMVTAKSYIHFHKVGGDWYITRPNEKIEKHPDKNFYGIFGTIVEHEDGRLSCYEASLPKGW